MKRRRLPYLRIKRLMWAHEWDAALALLDEFLAQYPNHPHALTTKGHIFEFLSAAGDSSRAKRKAFLGSAGRLYRRALRNVTHPVGRAAVMRDVGDYLSSVGQTARAIATYDRALAILASLRRTRASLEWREELLMSRYLALRSGTRAKALARSEWQTAQAEIEKRWPSRRAS